MVLCSQSNAVMNVLVQQFVTLASPIVFTVITVLFGAQYHRTQNLKCRLHLGLF